MDLDYKVLENIIKIDSPTGYCFNIINYIKNYLTTLGYEPTLNQKGNLVVEVKGKTSYVKGLSAHVDTLGLMVRSINSNGTLKFTTLGGTLLNTYNAEYCKIITRSGSTYTGTILSNSPAAHVYPDARGINLNEDTMHIRLDELVKTKSDVIKLGINTGDIIALDPKFEITKTGFIKTRFLDDKASAFMLLELLRLLKEGNITLNETIKVMFTTYEEVGHGAASIPEMDELLAVDMGCIGLDLNCDETMVSICVKDAGGPYDYQMITNLENIAKERNLNYCLDVYPFYSSDGTAALRGGNDIKCALIGSGIAASHGMERTHKQGIENTFKLILGYLGL